MVFPWPALSLSESQWWCSLVSVILLKLSTFLSLYEPIEDCRRIKWLLLLHTLESYLRRSLAVSLKSCYCSSTRALIKKISLRQLNTRLRYLAVFQHPPPPLEKKQKRKLTEASASFRLIVHAVALYSMLRELVGMPIRSNKWRNGRLRSPARWRTEINVGESLK